MILWQKDYHGFEHFSGYWRDVHEAVDPDFNPEMKKLPGEFQGRVRVTITYEAPSSDGEGELTKKDLEASEKRSAGR